MSSPTESIALSVIAPAHNEEDNVRTLVAEIEASVNQLALEYEMVIIDDGSTDATQQHLRELQASHPRLRLGTMLRTPPGKGHGQSAAFHAAVRAARGEWLVFLDADLQNDPADIPALLIRQRETDADMVQGDRSHARRDNFVRRVSSTISRWFRRVLLGDSIRDTGCSLRLIRKSLALKLPLQFRGQHRFIPMTARYLGFKVVEMSVNHRPRVAGKAKYGIWNRALPGLVDCFAVRWMRKRIRPVEFEEIRSS